MGDKHFALKAAVAAVLFALGFAGAVLPGKWKRLADSRTALGRGDGFASGVFIALAVIHLLPEAHEKLDKGYRVCEVITILGYTAMLFIEKVFAPQASTSEERSQLIPMSVQRLQEVHGDMLSGDTDSDEEFSPDARQFSFAGAAGASRKAALATILACVLSVHSVLEGVSVGIEDKDVVLLASGISFHKFITGVALGSSLAAGEMRHMVAAALIFAVSTPFGILLGCVADEFLPAVADGIIMSLSAGTFFYIGASELVPRIFANGDNVAKALFFLLGVACIYVMTLIEDPPGS
ncbi:Zinc transporter 7 [Diplonema papillatum]|nr:Zinc transporter 7 [Diplonema papillatum]|eukprot:gene10105-15534_t